MGNEWTPSLRDILDTMPDGLMALDGECRITLWNRAMENLTGWRTQEVIGKPCTFLECQSAFGDPLQNHDPHTECRMARNEKTLVEQVECTIRNRKGEIIPVLKNARLIRDNRGRIVGMVESLTDLRYRKRLEDEIAAWKRSLAPAKGIGRLVGRSHAMQEVYERIRLAAKSDATVLIHGDTGTGKELAADAIHALSQRRNGPFVKVNCSALPESLLESELFGHVRGAFTGAVQDKIGRFEAADHGTIFLDEIGDISPLIQLKLLRVIQEHAFERVGESLPRHTDVRVIAATHRNLRELVRQGLFREDFYYRIKVFDIRMPSLQERREDIPVLADNFIQRFNRLTGRTIKGVSPDVMYTFMNYPWPGNVRELENTIEHAFVTCQGDIIQIRDLPIELRTSDPDAIPHSHPATETPDRISARKRIPDRNTLLTQLHAAGWNKTVVARRLGVDRTTVWRAMKRWNIPLNRPENSETEP